MGIFDVINIIGIIFLISGFAVFVGAIYWLTQYLVRKKFGKGIAIASASIMALSIIAVISIFFIIDSSNWYKKEFKEIVGIDTPKSAKEIKSTSGCFAIGDYCYAILIELNQEDYKQLLEYINDNDKFSATGIAWSEAYEQAMSAIHDTGIKYAYCNANVKNGVKFIGFFSDGRHIIVEHANQ